VRTPARRLAGLLPAFLLLTAAAGAAPPLLWFHDGRPTLQATVVLAQLASAADHGLENTDYDSADLAAAVERLRSNPVPAQAELEQVDSALSRAAIRYAHDLHSGRIDARAAGFAIGPPRAPLDRDATLAGLASSNDPAAELDALEPPFVHYRLLESALHRYRELARQPGLTQLPPLPRRTVRLGEHYAGAPELRRLLVAVGDLAAADASVSADGRETLDAALVQALVRFQGRHGLETDGLLSRKTFQALAVPLAARVRSIELTLERWRWLSPFTAPPIIVNIPQFQLFAFRTTTDRAADIAQMPVIVGQSFREKRTPVFVSDIRYVVFRPFWDVPASIVRKEMLAPMRADPAFLERNDLEIVRGGGDDATPVAPDAASIDALAAGQLRLRQRPGPDNALGLIKFVMPNDYGVYLHSTPARQLFGKARRDFSHGCIRLSDPVALAVHVLRTSPGDWSAAAVSAAMGGSSTQRITLAAPVPVMVLYATALATEAGPVLFFDDIYGYDRRLERMLRARRAAR
jgi:murein L,D-transpeptidase YcbB/YkuD